MSETQGESEVTAAGDAGTAAPPPGEAAALVDAMEERVFAEQGNPLDSPDAQPTEEPLAEPPV